MLTDDQRILDISKFDVLNKFKFIWFSAVSLMPKSDSKVSRYGHKKNPNPINI